MEGTLKDYASKSFFTQRKIRLKSGTLRDYLGRPHIGWLAFVRQQGRAPLQILEFLQSKLEKMEFSDASPVTVEVLSSTDCSRVDTRCKFNFFSEDARSPPLYCFLSEIEVNQGKVDYSGTLTHDRQRRFFIRTSPEDYLTQVLASEFSQGMPEAQKAVATLAWLNQFNLHRHEHGHLCSTTHCQVYRNSVDPESEKGHALRKIAVEVIQWSKDHSREFPAWNYFSLGGTQEWEKMISIVEVSRLLDLQGRVQSIDLESSKVRIRSDQGESRSWGCERLRGKLKLWSCPQKISILENEIRFNGAGEGHSLGLDVTQANLWAKEGRMFDWILKQGK